MNEVVDALLIGIVWLIGIGAAIVLLVVVAGVWGGLQYRDAVLFEEELKAEHESEYPTDHVKLSDIDLPLGEREDDEDA